MEVGSSKKQLSVLLASASAGGTIAAARHLGAIGVEVRVISSNLLSAAAWSHYVSHSDRAPLEGESRLFLERLLAIGTAAPGQILLPTSDQTAWSVDPGQNAALLGRHFRVYQPWIESMRRIRRQKSSLRTRGHRRRTWSVAELGPAKPGRSRRFGAELALPDPHKTAHAGQPIYQERQGGRRPLAKRLDPPDVSSPCSAGGGDALALRS